MIISLLKYSVVLLLSLSMLAKAEPWVDTSDIYLKTNIQLLADGGHIITPTTTYPLMWNDIARDMRAISVEQLSEIELNAYLYIKYQLRLAQKAQTVIKVATSSQGSQFTSFGDKNRYQHLIQVESSYMTDSFAIKVAPGYAYGLNEHQEKEGEYITDGSYVAATLGNWVLAYGKQDRWYGPMWDSSFSLSNNTRPMPAISLSRKSAEPVGIPFTDIEIPWTLTTHMGKMDDDRTINNTLLWGFRLNFKPLDNLEFGISRIAQWAGDGHSKSLSTFWDILLGKTNCGIDGVVCDVDNPNPANQQAGYDMRLSLNVFDTPMGLYGNYFAEDGDASGGLNFFTKAEIQVGVDAQLMLFNRPTTAFIEYGDSLADCGERDGIGNCYYEHSTYTTGLRYNGRTISNLYDNDAKTIVVGAFSQLKNNLTISNKLRWLKLNYDNLDKAPDNPLIGNPLANQAENMLMYSVNVEHSYKHWRYSVGGDFSHSSFENDIDNDNEINLYLNIEYML